MSLRIVPKHAHPTHATASHAAPSAPGVHDTLRANLSLAAPAPTTTSDGASTTTTTAAAQPESSHPLEARLVRWRATQDAAKMEGLRRAFGLAEPLRRGMELRSAAAGEWQPAVFGGNGGMTGVHGDVLAGRDCEIGWEDVFTGGEELRPQPDFHTEMEARMRMNW